MKGLFWRNKHHLDGKRQHSHPTPGASSVCPESPSADILPPHHPPSISDSSSVPGGIWYRRPTTTTTNGANVESDTLSHFGHLYQHQRAVVPSSSQSTHTGTFRRKTDRKKEAHPLRNPKKEAGLLFHRKKKNGYVHNKVTTNVLITSLIQQNWHDAFSHIESQPDLIWQQDTIFLHGHKTIALPLHIACCVDPPPALFDQILRRFPDGAQQTDEVMGRLPLHWACMSNAAIHVLEMLIQSFPDACKSYDLAKSRSPLHYLTMYAYSMDQFQPLLTAPVNHKRIMQHADREGMTPLDLARSTNSPIKAEIVASLVHHEQIALANSQRRKQNPTEEGQISTSEYLQSSHKAPIPTGSNGKILPGHLRDELHAPSRQSYGISPTPGAQADAFTDHVSGQNSTPPLPPKHTARRSPQNRNKVPTLSLDHHNGVNETFKSSALPPAEDFERSPHRHLKDPMRSAFHGMNHLSDPPIHQEDMESRYAARPKAAEDSPDSWNYNYAKYAEKADAEYKDNMYGKEIADQKQHFRSNSNERNPMSAQSMMDEMFMNMNQLEDEIKKIQSDLKEKQIDIGNLNAAAREMAMREQSLMLGLENSRNVVRHQHEKLNQKREDVELLKDKIATLQAELAKEESILLPMEKTILLLEQELIEKEQSLQEHREEQASFAAMRRSILQEKDCLTRDLENSNSELQSLKAIQDLAKGQEDNV